MTGWDGSVSAAPKSARPPALTHWSVDQNGDYDEQLSAYAGPA